jgi:hypothetical protein
MEANSDYGWGYVYGETDWTAFPGRTAVRNYHPEDSDVDGDGDVDAKEDGCGPWIFQSYTGATISTATALSYTADTGASYFLSQTYVSNYLAWAFRVAGDCELPYGEIDTGDGWAIKEALGTSPPHADYNPDADIAETTGGTPPRWDSATGTAIPPNPKKIDAYDWNKWARSLKTAFPRLA